MAENTPEAIPLNQLEQLNSFNWFRHTIYVATLQELSSNLDFYRDYFVQRIKEDYGIGFEKLKAKTRENKANDDFKKVLSLEQQLLAILDEEKLLALSESKLNDKNRMLEELRQLSVKYFGHAFIFTSVHLTPLS